MSYQHKDIFASLGFWPCGLDFTWFYRLERQGVYCFMLLSCRKPKSDLSLSRLVFLAHFWLIQQIRSVGAISQFPSVDRILSE